jgi:hypothetical protein
MAIVLLVSIAIGTRLGDRVLGQQIGRQVPIAGTIPTPKPEPVESGFNDSYWKRVKIITVATDPAFPDPRVTPTPEPTPRPTPRPTPTQTPRPPSASPTPNDDYTSPPLPVPIVTHEPDNEYGTPVPGRTPDTYTPPPGGG